MGVSGNTDSGSGQELPAFFISALLLFPMPPSLPTHGILIWRMIETLNVINIGSRIRSIYERMVLQWFTASCSFLIQCVVAELL